MLVVHGDDRLALGGALERGEAIVGLELREHLGRAQRRHVVEIAGQQRRDLGGGVVDEPELHLLDLHVRRVAMAVELLHLDRVALGPLHEAVGSGADRVGVRAGEAALVEDHRGGLRQFERQQAAGAVEVDDDGVRVRRLHRLHGPEQLLLLVRALRPGIALELRLHVGGVEVRAVVILHPLLEAERVGGAVFGDGPGLREHGMDVAAAVESRQSFEDVVQRHLADGCGGPGGRIETRGGLEAHADADRVLGEHRSARQGGQGDGADCARDGFHVGSLRGVGELNIPPGIRLRGRGGCDVCGPARPRYRWSRNCRRYILRGEFRPGSRHHPGRCLQCARPRNGRERSAPVRSAGAWGQQERIIAHEVETDG